jgi:hypothetical protein
VIRVSLKLTPRVLPRWLGGKISSGQRSRGSHPPQLSQYGETICGRIFSSFLALILREKLAGRRAS